MAYNLSQDTMIRSYEDGTKMGLSREDINESPNGFLFCNKEPGILPTILARLLGERKQAKKRMKDADNDFDKAVWNGQQLALKASIFVGIILLIVLLTLCFLIIPGWLQLDL